MRLHQVLPSNHLSRISIILIEIAGLFALSCLGTAMAQSAPEALGKIELMGFLAGGSSNGYVELLLRQRGIAFVPNDDDMRMLRLAGAQEFLLADLRDSKASDSPAVDAHQSTVLAPLARCAELEYKQSFAEAEPFCQQAQAADPQSPAPYLAMSLTLVQEKKLEEASASARRAVELAPTMGRTHVGLGRALQAKGDNDAALAEFREALRLDPSEIDAIVDQGLVLSRFKKDQSGAIELYRQALRIQPNSSRAHMALGNALRFENDYDGAIAEFQRAARLDTDGVWPRLNLGMAFFDHKNYDEAVTAYRDGLRIEPSNGRLHAELGWALLAKGDADAGITELREAIRLAPEIGMAHRVLGQALLRKGDRTAAVAELRKAIQLEPDSQDPPTAQSLLFQALFESDDREARGSVSGQIYKNDFFGFTYALPQGWSALSLEELKKLDEENQRQSLEKLGPNGRRLVESGVLTLESEWTLFRAALSEPQSRPGRFPPLLTVSVEKGNPFQRGELFNRGNKPIDNYFQYSSVADPLQSPNNRMERKPTPLSIGGRDFVRADFRIKRKGGDIWESRMVTFAKDYFLVLEIGAASREDLERFAQAASSFTFSTTKE